MHCKTCLTYLWHDSQPTVWTNPVSRDEFCVFHAPQSKKGISGALFNELIHERIASEAKRIGKCNLDEKINLGGVVFPHIIHFNKYNKSFPLHSISFLAAVFCAQVNFQFVYFDGAVDFSKAEFHQWASFEGATFSKAVTFEEVKFLDGAYFSRTLFQANSSFADSISIHKVFFKGSEFSGVANFNGLMCQRELYFTGIMAQTHNEISVG